MKIKLWFFNIKQWISCQQLDTHVIRKELWDCQEQTSNVWRKVVSTSNKRILEREQHFFCRYCVANRFGKCWYAENGSFCLNNHEIKFWSTGSRLSYFLEIPLVENFVSTKSTRWRRARHYGGSKTICISAWERGSIVQACSWFFSSRENVWVTWSRKYQGRVCLKNRRCLSWSLNILSGKPWRKMFPGGSSGKYRSTRQKETFENSNPNLIFPSPPFSSPSPNKGKINISSGYYFRHVENPLLILFHLLCGTIFSRRCVTPTCFSFGPNQVSHFPIWFVFPANEM